MSVSALTKLCDTYVSNKGKSVSIMLTLGYVSVLRLFRDLISEYFPSNFDL